MINKVFANLLKKFKNNRILMIASVFIVMGVSVALIQFLQEKTLERFTSAYKTSNRTELSEGEHGLLHADCDHINEDGNHHTCGHAHTKEAASDAAAAGLKNNVNNTYTVNEKGKISKTNA